MENEQIVEIEVGGDHGDGIVEVVKKSKGVKVVIRDYDAAYYEEGQDLQESPTPATTEYASEKVI